MKHHQMKMLTKARRIGATILMCLLIQQLGLHNSQGDEQRISSTTFMSLMNNRELFHGERAEASVNRQQQHGQRLSPPTIVTSHIPALNVISSLPRPTPPPSVLPATHDEQRTIEKGDDNRSLPSESTIKTTSIAHNEIVKKANHRVQRDQETRPKAEAHATIATELPHLMLNTNEIHSDHEIYISEPAVPADLKASDRTNIKKGRSILEWLKDKHRLKQAIGQTVLNEIEISKLGSDRFGADGHTIVASTSIVATKLPTSAPKSIGADKLSIILMEDRLRTDNAKSGSKSRRTPDKRMAPMVTSVLPAPTATPPQSPVVSVDKGGTINPCGTDNKALCFSKFLFGDSHLNVKMRTPAGVLASKTDLEHLVSGEKPSKKVAASINTDPSQRFMHFG